MFRHVLGILCGYLLFGAGTLLLFRGAGVDPRAAPPIGFAVLATLAGATLAFSGAYFASIVSPFGGRAARHLALLMAAVAIASAIAEWGTASPWTQAVAVILFVPAALAGGALADQRVTKGL